MPIVEEDTRVPSNPMAPPKKRPWLMVLVGVVVAAVLLAAAVLATRPQGEPTQPPGESSPPSQAPGESAPVGDEVAPGLTRAPDIALEATNTDAVYGIPVGYPQTRAGGIVAAINHDAAYFSPAMLNKAARTELNKRLYTADGQRFARDEAALKELYPNADDSGRVIDPKTKKPNDQLSFIGGCYPRYGAFKVDSVQPSIEKPDEVTVTTWTPCAMGPGSDDDLSQVVPFWNFNSTTVRWEDGDWKVAYVYNHADTTSWPEDPRAVNLTFEERAKTLKTSEKHGWQVSADATEEAVPGAVRTR